MSHPDPTFLVANDPSEPLRSSHGRTILRLKRPEPAEAQVLRGVLRALSLHPKVARVWRNNTGSGHLTHGKGNGASQYITFGFKGSPDIHGYMRDGRALYVEAKRPSAKPTAEQQSFLDAASKAGCVAFVARSVDDVFAALEAA